MADYKKYIYALKKCAKEHEGERTSTGHIIVSDLCEDTAKLLEGLKQEHTPENSTEFADRCRECGKQKMDETKSVRDIIDEVKNDVCDKLCKYPMEEGHEEDWLYKDNSPCMTCPLNRL